MHVLWQAAQGSRTWQVSTRGSIGLKKTGIRKLMARKELFAGGHRIMCICEVDGKTTVGAIGVQVSAPQGWGKGCRELVDVRLKETRESESG